MHSRAHFSQIKTTKAFDWIDLTEIHKYFDTSWERLTLLYISPFLQNGYSNGTSFTFGPFKIFEGNVFMFFFKF